MSSSPPLERLNTFQCNPALSLFGYSGALPALPIIPPPPPPAPPAEENKSEASRRSKSRDHDRDRDKERDRNRSSRDPDKDRRDRDRDRGRDKDYDDKDKDYDRKKRDRDRDRDSRNKRDNSRDRERSRERDRYRSSRRDSRERDREARRSRSRPNDDYESRRKRRNRSRSNERRGSRYERDDRRHDRRSRSRSYERRRRDRSGDRDRRNDRGRRERSNSFDRERDHMNRERKSRLEGIKEENRDNRFDLTQTIQELMNSTTSSKNFANLFSSNNSNDSFNGPISENSQDENDRKKRKKSRWGGTENDKTFIPGMPTILPASLDATQQEAYLVQLQIEEISRKLRTGDLGIPQNPEERSPSPEPIYSSDGKRLNTREFRFRKRLEEQRHTLIQKMQSVNPEFKPPSDYKPPVTRVSDKVLIPQDEHPDINFVGLLIGPRGNTLKAMEKKTGAKIIIRGKGSVKEGKVGRKDGQPLPGEDEPLHAFITAPNHDAVKKAVEQINEVIRQGIEVPEGHNDLRRMQLRELAQLNGTLRENDCQRCTNCGSTEHKSWLCPDKPNVTSSIVCTSCGGAGHIAKDCRTKRPGAGGGTMGPAEDSQAKIDEEYLSLMAELGEGPPQTAKPAVDPLAQAHINRGYSIFDKKPTQMQAIQAAPHQNLPPPMLSNAPPPPIPPGWAPPAPTGMGAMPNSQPALPPMIPWNVQPPPPGGETLPPLPPGTGNLQPPGTGPMPPLIPPGVPGAAPLPPWGGPSMYGAWNGNYLPPPPPPCGPPGIPGMSQPPPPPPPSN